MASSLTRKHRVLLTSLPEFAALSPMTKRAWRGGVICSTTSMSSSSAEAGNATLNAAHNITEGNGGAGGIRTLDRALQPYNGLANRRLQPLGHVSGWAGMPDVAASRKRQIVDTQES